MIYIRLRHRFSLYLGEFGLIAIVPIIAGRFCGGATATSTCAGEGGEEGQTRLLVRLRSVGAGHVGALSGGGKVDSADVIVGTLLPLQGQPTHRGEDSSKCAEPWPQVLGLKPQAGWLPPLIGLLRTEKKELTNTTAIIRYSNKGSQRLEDAKLDELPPSERMLPCFRIGQFGGYVLRPEKLPFLATDAPRTITYGIFFIP